MRTRTLLCRILVGLASVGIVLPQLAYGVEQAQTARPKTQVVRDVALDAQGSLHGKLLDANGKAVAANAVLLRQNGQVAGQAKTDASGRFAVAGVRAGVYEIASAQSSGAYRVWAHNSAPPSATDSVLLVDQKDVVRGQGGGWQQIMLVTGLVITAGVIGGVIGYNLKDDDDDES